MKSVEYRSIIAQIVRNSLKKEYPGFKKDTLNHLSGNIARAIHARMYGANVDGVDSPIWRDVIQGPNNPNPPPNLPNVDASELLNQKETK